MVDKLNKSKPYSSVLIALAAGLYPFFHYYGNNFNIADSWPQFIFLFSICVLVPVALVFILPYIFRLGFLRRLRKYYLTSFNFMYFTGLLGLLIFHFPKGTFVMVLLAAGLLGFALYRFLNKIVILQFLLAVMSLVSLIPRLFFVASYDDGWTRISENISEVKFKQTPNIYFIQPDGFANFSDLRKPPYNYLDFQFEHWLSDQGFVHYDDFRSNYFTTLTSNSATFAMKHHYFQNIGKYTAKTYGTAEVIVGDNNALRVLKRNGYKTHLFTDNSFFLLNRKLKAYDFCNVPQNKLSLHKMGRLMEVDIISDFDETLKMQEDEPNFYFIEKTIPGHIRNSKGSTRGIKIEREKYFEGMESANNWLTTLIGMINEHDENPFIVIMADHGGYVGLSYLSELDERKLNEQETASVFTSILSVKWPNNEVPDNLSLKSSVNIFRNMFYYLSDNPLVLESYQSDSSFIYTMENNFVEVYECLDENGTYGYKKIE